MASLFSLSFEADDFMSSFRFHFFICNLYALSGESWRQQHLLRRKIQKRRNYLPSSYPLSPNKYVLTFTSLLKAIVNKLNICTYLILLIGISFIYIYIYIILYIYIYIVLLLIFCFLPPQQVERELVPMEEKMNRMNYLAAE